VVGAFQGPLFRAGITDGRGVLRTGRHKGCKACKQQ
jgi:hypothetical protein